MVRRQSAQPTITRTVTDQDREFLEAMATDVAGDEKTRKKLQQRARLILTMIEGTPLPMAAQQGGMTATTAKGWCEKFNTGGWTALLTIQPPRGGDFLARYDLGYWAEGLARDFLDHSREYRAIPYGTSRSDPFTDMQKFRKYVETEAMLQVWSASGRWKRPGLLMIPREHLRQQMGNDVWTPDLQHIDNAHCRPYVKQAAVAIEVETSLWEVRKAKRLSFTVKEEDLEALRNWVKSNRVPLFVVQVFYDSAYALPFATLEYLMALPAGDKRRAVGNRDRTTKKMTYMVPLDEGVLLGDMPEPEVEGKVFKAPNGKVTVYGRLTGSAIEIADQDVLEQLAAGKLKGGKRE